MEKAAVFIDGGYLSQVLRQHFSDVHIDYYKFSEELCNSIEAKRLRTYYYNCMPVVREDNEKDRERYNKMQKFLDKLRRLPRFEVELGRLQLVNGVFKQKMVDVKMSLDIVDVSFNGQVDHVILVAGDSDFVPAVRRAKKYGRIVHLYYYSSTVHKNILDEIDEAHEISEDLIMKCKLD